jgi:hypothetical protein
MPVSRLFDDFPFYDPSRLVQTLCDRIALDGVENVRGEAMRRLEAGDLPLELGAPLFSCFDVQPVASELRRILQSPSSTVDTRLIAFAALGNTGADLIHEVESMDREAADVLKANLRKLRETMAAVRSGGGGPFRGLVKADPDDVGAVEEQIASIVQLFLESPEAEPLPDREIAGWWIHEFLLLAHSNRLGTPLGMMGSDVEDVLSELMPLNVSIESEEEALPAIPALRAFFDWVAHVTGIPASEKTSQLLDALEPHFPLMLMEETRFGPAKGFLTAGLNAGFDMSTPTGLEAFQRQWNREHAQSRPDATKKDVFAKKRKARMEKASRKKNRKKR